MGIAIIELGVGKYFKQSPLIPVYQSWQTGVLCHAYGGGTIFVIVSGNTSDGDGTQSEIGFIRQAWDANGNGEYVHIAGVQSISYSVDSNKEISLTMGVDNARYLLISNQAFA